MRTTVNLDPDVYDFASAYAGGKGITLSAAISELIRRAEQMPEPEQAAGHGRLVRNEYGYLEIVGGDILTLERVKELSEDELV